MVPLSISLCRSGRMNALYDDIDLSDDKPGHLFDSMLDAVLDLVGHPRYVYPVLDYYGDDQLYLAFLSGHSDAAKASSVNDLQYRLTQPAAHLADPAHLQGRC